MCKGLHGVKGFNFIPSWLKMYGSLPALEMACLLSCFPHTYCTYGKLTQADGEAIGNLEGVGTFTRQKQLDCTSQVKQRKGGFVLFGPDLPPAFEDYDFFMNSYDTG